MLMLISYASEYHSILVAPSEHVYNLQVSGFQLAFFSLLLLLLCLLFLFFLYISFLYSLCSLCYTLQITEGRSKKKMTLEVSILLVSTDFSEIH